MPDEIARSEPNSDSESSIESALMAEPVQHSVSQNPQEGSLDATKAEHAFQATGHHPSANSKAKRMVDLIVSISGLAVLSPLLTLIAALIKFDSPGPVIFSQKRVGLNGKLFQFYKFRSMYQESSSEIHRDYIKELICGKKELQQSPDEREKVFKLAKDQRITKFGRILRRTSLDELPQLMNVLRGDMSLVGPRPAITYEVEMYKDWYRRRLTVLPGMTGLWQTRGRSQRTFDEMVELDLEYIDQWSLWLDLKILWRTVFVVLRREGAW